jgi:hypothetical protein
MPVGQQLTHPTKTGTEKQPKPKINPKTSPTVGKFKAPIPKKRETKPKQLK